MIKSNIPRKIDKESEEVNGNQKLDEELIYWNKFFKGEAIHNREKKFIFLTNIINIKNEELERGRVYIETKQRKN